MRFPMRFLSSLRCIKDASPLLVRGGDPTKTVSRTELCDALNARMLSRISH
jgi:hypothetical protein